MYFKILRENLTPYDFTYKEGLNVDPNPFDPDPVCGGGLFFSDEKRILTFGRYGTKIAEVMIPDGEQVVSVQDKYKAHQIVLGGIHDLWTVETFEWLRCCGVDLHADNDFALRLAAKGGYLDVIKYLVEQKADIRVDNDYVLCCAAMNGHLEIIKYLVKLGANIHAWSECPLRFAASNGHPEVVKYFAELGSNIHACCDDSLYSATKNGHLEVVEYLNNFEKHQQFQLPDKGIG